MKRTVLLVLLVSAFAVGAASRPALKFPWAGEALNRLRTMTELEWRVSTNAIRRGKTIPLTKHFILIGLTATIKEQGLVVKAEAVTRPNLKLRPGTGEWEQACRDACNEAFWMVQERFGEGRGFDDKAFGHWQNIALGLIVNDMPMMEVIGGNGRMIPQQPTVPRPARR